MNNYFHSKFYALLLLLLYVTGTTLGFSRSSKNAEAKCIERERQSLLKFKQSLFDGFGMLSTWRDDENNGDCYKWKGIECNIETGHIQKLDLRGGDDTQYLRGVINLTSLIDLQYMEYLDLSNNYFYGSLISEDIGSFTELKYLNLSNSEFGGRIPYQLGNLSKLEYLDLSDNYYIDGEIPHQLGYLSQLQYLDLWENYLSGALPFHNRSLPMLHTLKLSVNFDLTINDAEWLSTLSSLTNLALQSGSSNQWLQTIRKLIPNLRELRLVGCGLLDNDIASLFRPHSNFSFSLTILDLSNNMLTSSTFQFLSNFSLNLQELDISENDISLSSPLNPNFPSLLILDLSNNNLSSSKFQGNFNFSSKLQQLSLSNCSLMDRSFLVSPASIVNSSSSLVFLDLSDNLLKSSDVFHWISNFTNNLHSLSLPYNSLEGPIPNGFGKVTNSLKDLYLYENNLQGEIPAFFGNMCTLQTLYLSNNNLSGEISSFMQNSSRCNKNILRSLDLSDNQITGMIPESIGLLFELERLWLDGNSLEGDITESHLSNFSKLISLSLSYNSLSLKFATSWVPPFQLLYLNLASCKLGPSFPSWIQTQRQLMYLDISHADLNDSVPQWLWNNSQYMRELNMSHNSLMGTIPDSQFKLHWKPSIYLNSNQFEGGVPSFLLQASKLILSQNKFSDLFSFLCDKNSTAASLVILDLSYNQIEGQLPHCWKSANTLSFLDLRNNKLSSNIPYSMGTLVKLRVLVLRNNSLKGELPSTLKNCANLILLDVGENLLSGPIPSWIGESMPELIILSITGNRFYGSLPTHLCYLRHIQLLDLSRNNLSKGIPTCLRNFTAMSGKSINTNEIQSHIYVSISIYYGPYGIVSFGDYEFNITLNWKGVEQWFKDPELRLLSIDLSSNNLNGEIPKEIGDLVGLVSLNLSRNNLSGEIPSEIGKLTSLDFLDLSRNHLSGIIPSTISKIDRLGVLDLSNNSLHGRIPLGRQLQTFDPANFEGNPNLCGEPLPKICPKDVTIVKPKVPAAYGEDDNSPFYEALYMSLGFGFFTGFWGLLGPILFWRPWRIAYQRFLNILMDYIYVMVVVNMAKFQRWLKQ